MACRGHHDVVLESLALRHQLRTWQRRVKRPHLRSRDRLFWVLVATCASPRSKPDYVEAVVHKDLLLRLQANLEPTR
jgi:hypothetical protein